MKPLNVGVDFYAADTGHLASGSPLLCVFARALTLCHRNVEVAGSSCVDAPSGRYYPA